MPNNDRLEEAWNRLGQEIQQKERELAELRRKLKVLDEARLLIMKEESHAGSSAHARATPIPPKTFTESVLRAIEEQPPNDGGFTAAEIARSVRAMGFANQASSANSYHASVYVTLMRLAKRGDIRAISTEKGRRFAKNDTTGALFGHPVGAIQ